MQKIITLGLLTTALSLTTLANNNCPTNLNVTHYNTSLTQGGSSLVKTFYGSLISASLQSTITAKITTG